MMRKSIWILSGIATAFSTAALANPSLDASYGDHMVLQRGQPMLIGGTAAPGAKISGTLGSMTATSTADNAGNFTLTFPARAASAVPITLSVSDGSGTVTASDILIGDVWLCSGQSNMEYTLERSDGGALAVQNSADQQLRILAVPKSSIPEPSRKFGKPASWAAASPATVPDFSAACFYMAQQLRAKLGIPIGAVGSYWGGSQIRAWMSSLSATKLYGADQMALLHRYAKNPLDAVTAFAPEWEKWWKGKTGGEPWRNPASIDWQPVPKISPWGEWTGTPLAKNTVGNVLLRHTVDLTKQEASAGGTLSIGIIDDGDMTFVNGHPVGDTFSWDSERHYRVPVSYLHAGTNEILVVASNSWGEGGFQSPADHLNFVIDGGKTIPLSSDWQFAVAKTSEMPPHSPWDQIAGIGVMHNGMIAPLGPMRFKGGAWYQGESDAGIPGYAGKLSELFAGWRRQFGNQMKMLVVQLPNYGERSDHPVASGWAQIRDDERAAVATDDNAALVSVIDIGRFDELHPPDKLDVGKRLALAAEGEGMPMPKAVRSGEGKIVVTFDGIEGGLHAFSGSHPLAVELCGVDQPSCRYATATINGDSLQIADDGKPATRVRYAWSDAPIVNLYDGRGLPVPGFEMKISR